MLVTPVSRIAIVMSRVLHSSATVVIQCMIILGVAMIFGSRISLGVGSLILSFLVIFLLASGFAALSNGIAILLKREEPLVVLGNLMTLPLMFFSSAMVPRGFMPDWIKAIASVNPIDYAVEAVRALFAGGVMQAPVAWGLGFLLFFATVTVVWSTEMFMNQGE
jgi:ABC-2 type transport system permease protein